MDAREEDIVGTKIQPSTKVQTLIKAQLKVMEIKMCELNVATKRRRTIMDKATHLEKNICILNVK
jgi:hypothetical protein